MNRLTISFIAASGLACSALHVVALCILIAR